MAQIEKRNNTYRIKIFCGRNSSGKRLFKNFTYKPTPNMTEKQIKKELERLSFEYEQKYKDGLYFDDNMRFSEFAEYWRTEYAIKQLKKKTIARYDDLLVRILEVFGNTSLNKILPCRLLQFYNDLHGDNVRRDLKFYTIIENPREFIKSNNLSQIGLAERAGVSVKTVESFVNKNNISSLSAEKISSALDISFNDLFVVAGKKFLSDKTILEYHRLLNSMFEKAVKWQILRDNPCKHLEPPKSKKIEARYLDEVETIKLLKCLEYEPLKYKAMINILLYSGMRRGELCGLTWDDIDFKNNLIDINKTHLYLSGSGVFEDTTKTESSKRIIKLPKFIFDMLKLLKKEQSADRLRLGTKWTDSDFVFVTKFGAPIHPDTVSSWFKKFIKKNNLPDITIHSLRHTSATLLIMQGVNIKTVSARLGHSNVSTTQNIYTHAIKSADEIASDTLELTLINK